MKTLHYYLLLSFTLLLTMAFQCEHDYVPGCYYLDVTLFTQDSIIFSKVVNQESGEAVWVKDTSSIYGDTTYFSLPLNPEKALSSFVFYWPAQNPDTLAIRHDYQEGLDEGEDYYFQLRSAQVDQNTFGNRFIITSTEQCVEAELDLQ